MMFSADARAPQGRSMSWSVASNIRAATIGVDLSLEDSSAGGTICVKDVIDKVDTAFMASAEGSKGTWSAVADFKIVKVLDVWVE